MNKIMLYDFLIKSAKNIIKFQNPDGSFPPGHNGAHFDVETPVRNTGNWLITLLKVYSLTNEEEYFNSAEKALNYLLSSEVRPMGASFWHRLNPQKDFCNGLMGQAFTLEALAYAYAVLGSEQAKIIAEEVFLMHPFIDKIGGWQRVAVDGSYLTYDTTFNHQLCFAAAGAYLAAVGGNEQIRRRVLAFLDKTEDTLKIYHFPYRGMIMHPFFTITFSRNGVKGLVKRVILSNRQNKHTNVKRAMAYHAYNLYAFSLLKQIYPEHKFWSGKKFARILKFIESKEYTKKVESEGFSYPYSPAGFETAFAERAFTQELFYPEENNSETIKRLLVKHFEKTFDFDTFMMNKRTADPETQAARIYKLTRLSNIELNFNAGEDKGE